MDGAMDQPNQDQTESAGGGHVSQDDIDALFGGDPAAESAPQVNADTEPTSGAIAQDDIDALQGGAESNDSTDSGAIAQDDIDALLNSAGSDDSTDSGAMGQDGIDALLSGAGGEGDTEASVPAADERVDTLGRPFDAAAAAMAEAIAAEKTEASAAAPSATAAEPAPLPPPPPGSSPFDAPVFDVCGDLDVDPKRVDMLGDVNLHVKIRLGSTVMRVEEVLRLDDGSVVELDKLAGDPVDVIVNDRLIARGEVLVLNDVFCVRISEVLSVDPHRVT